MTNTEHRELQKIFLDLKKLIPKLSTQKWRHLMKLLDPQPQNVIDVNLDPEDYKYDPTFSEGRCLDVQLLSQKVSFTDLLRVMQKESELREHLTQSSLFFQSTKRLIYSNETKLMNK